MFGFSKSKKKLEERVKELESALGTAHWRAEALLKDLKKAEAHLSDRSRRLMHLEFEHRALIKRFNRLVEEHNAMVDAGAFGAASPFSPEDLKVLIGLCHPDKHSGKDSAKRITQMLLEMRR